MIYLSASAADVTGAPKEIKILPLGRVRSQKGDFVVDAESFALMKAEFEKRQLDKVIDYEHQTLADVQAPAAGWIKALRLTDNAIVAEVEWNPKAEEYLKNREYRYLSPVIKVRPSDHKAVLLHSVALTNTPAVDGMFAICKDGLEGEDEEGEDNMDWKEIAKLLGLPEDATPEQIKEGLQNLLAELKDLKEAAVPAADETVCKLLGVAPGAKTEDVTAAIMALKSTGEETVSKAEYLALKERLDRQDSAALVEMALKEGKIAPAQADWAKEYALKDPAGFKAFMEKAPAIVPLKEVVCGAAPKGEKKLGDEELMALKALGVSAEDVKKYGGEE